jgi:uncharacterized protein (DUF58 family)
MRPALATALLGLALILTAAAFDAEPLYVPGLAFVFISGGAALWVAAGARGVSVVRTVAARTVQEEDPVAVDLVVSSSTLALPSGVVDDPLLPQPAPLAAGKRRTVVRITVRFSRRGRKLLAPPRVVVRDPFGLATRVVGESSSSDEVLVLPRVLPIESPAAGGEGDAIGLRRGRPWVAAEIDLDGLRPHRPGAPASRIHWAAFARTGELLERRLRADSDTRPLVVLDPRGGGDGVADFEADLDAALRATASLCVHLAHTGGCALLLPGDRRPVVIEPGLHGWPRIHVRLALVDSLGAPAIGGLASRRGPVLYVAARRMHRPPRALAHAPGGGRVLVVPGTLAGRTAAFRVGGCTGYELTASPGRRARYGAVA